MQRRKAQPWRSRWHSRSHGLNAHARGEAAADDATHRRDRRGEGKGRLRQRQHLSATELYQLLWEHANTINSYSSTAFCWSQCSKRSLGLSVFFLSFFLAMSGGRLGVYVILVSGVH